MAIDFPTAPSVGDTHEAAGKKWACVAASPTPVWKLQSADSTPGIALSGRVADYASLPSSGLGAGDAYLVDSDGQVYVYDGTVFPDEGSGLSSRGKTARLALVDNDDNLLRLRAFVYASTKRMSTSNGRDYQRLVDGSTSTASYVELAGGAGPQFVVTVTPSSLYMNRIVLHHYWTDGRSYHDNKVEISEDGENWIILFDSNVDGEYPETSVGKTIDFPAQYAKFIRNTINGSTANTGNHFVQIQAFYVP